MPCYFVERAPLATVSLAGTRTVTVSFLAPRKSSIPSRRLTDPDDLANILPLACAFVAVAQQIDSVAEAFRSGGGMPYAAYGQELVDRQARIDWPVCTHLHAGWLAEGMPDVHAAAGGGVWSSIALDVRTSESPSKPSCARPVCCFACRASLTEEGAVGTETVMRAATLDRYAREAGFAATGYSRSSTRSSGCTGCGHSAHLG
ncbi:MAG: hypothetical protein C4558_01860 [Dehalococcoidia bacterium]|nr:MAG: hypothetical protein C4558_01860 [Dehalococcoidia bacterium]